MVLTRQRWRLEHHVDFYAAYFATFGTDIPWMSTHQEVLTVLAKRYAVWPPKTKSKILRDWACNEGSVIRTAAAHMLLLAKRSVGSRSSKIGTLKEIIRQTILDEGLGNPEDALEAAVGAIESEEALAVMSPDSDASDVDDLVAGMKTPLIKRSVQLQDTGERAIDPSTLETQPMELDFTTPPPNRVKAEVASAVRQANAETVASRKTGKQAPKAKAGKAKAKSKVASNSNQQQQEPEPTAQQEPEPAAQQEPEPTAQEPEPTAQEPEPTAQEPEPRAQEPAPAAQQQPPAAQQQAPAAQQGANPPLQSHAGWSQMVIDVDVMEMFSGSCMLTKSMRDAGYRVLWTELTALDWVWMSSSITKRFDAAYGVLGDTTRDCVRDANIIASRTMLLLMVAVAMGIDFIVKYLPKLRRKITKTTRAAIKESGTTMVGPNVLHSAAEIDSMDASFEEAEELGALASTPQSFHHFTPSTPLCIATDLYDFANMGPIEEYLKAEVVLAFLRAAYGDHRPEMDCGSTIEVQVKAFAAAAKRKAIAKVQDDIAEDLQKLEQNLDAMELESRMAAEKNGSGCSLDLEETLIETEEDLQQAAPPTQLLAQQLVQLAERIQSGSGPEEAVRKALLRPSTIDFEELFQSMNVSPDAGLMPPPPVPAKASRPTVPPLKASSEEASNYFSSPFPTPRDDPEEYQIPKPDEPMQQQPPQQIQSGEPQAPAAKPDEPVVSVQQQQQQQPQQIQSGEPQAPAAKPDEPMVSEQQQQPQQIQSGEPQAPAAKPDGPMVSTQQQQPQQIQSGEPQAPAKPDEPPVSAQQQQPQQIQSGMVSTQQQPQQIQSGVYVQAQQQQPQQIQPMVSTQQQVHPAVQQTQQPQQIQSHPQPQAPAEPVSTQQQVPQNQQLPQQVKLEPDEPMQQQQQGAPQIAPSGQAEPPKTEEEVQDLEQKYPKAKVDSLIEEKEPYPGPEPIMPAAAPAGVILYVWQPMDSTHSFNMLQEMRLFKCWVQGTEKELETEEMSWSYEREGDAPQFEADNSNTSDDRPTPEGEIKRRFNKESKDVKAMNKASTHILEIKGFRTQLQNNGVDKGLMDALLTSMAQHHEFISEHRATVEAAVATGVSGKDLEEKVLLLTQANSTYVTQSKHVKANNAADLQRAAEAMIDECRGHASDLHFIKIPAYSQEDNNLLRVDPEDLARYWESQEAGLGAKPPGAGMVPLGLYGDDARFTKGGGDKIIMISMNAVLHEPAGDEIKRYPIFTLREYLCINTRSLFPVCRVLAWSMNVAWH
ncbi:unnamed protein product [Symbiodinium microadriaticum]|nr:unnamed protein product [Symbiodinium microadriaticum]